MSFVWRLGAMVVVGGALATACGGSVTSDGAGKGSPAAPEAPTAAGFPAQLEQLACDTLETCCSAAHLTFDRAACAKAFNVNAVQTGEGISFDSAAAQRCLDEFKTATNACSAFDKSQLPDCSRTTRGTLPLGAACTSSRQCAPTNGRIPDCQYAPDANIGTCALEETPAHAAPGDRCQTTCTLDDGCETGTSTASPTDPVLPPPVGACYVADALYCSSSSQTCTSIGNKGDICYASNGCSSGLVCVGLAESYTTDSGQVRPGKCGPPQAEGAPCVTSEECVTLACDPAAAVCTHVPLATAGLCLGVVPGAD